MPRVSTDSQVKIIPPPRALSDQIKEARERKIGGVHCSNT